MIQSETGMSDVHFEKGGQEKEKIKGDEASSKSRQLADCGREGRRRTQAGRSTSACLNEKVDKTTSTTITTATTADTTHFTTVRFQVKIGINFRFF